MTFSNSLALPEYLEDALAPFSWSGILSPELRHSVILVLLASERQSAAEDFIKSIELIKFLDPLWIKHLSDALRRFAVEGFAPIAQVDTR